MSIRKASHSGSWYSSSATKLNNELTEWLKAAPSHKGDIRAIIAPHAGLSYSGATAAYAYKNILPENIKRVFILGPSHHVRLNSCALSPATYYQTPFYNVKIDSDIYKILKSSSKFKSFNIQQDEDEHSLEMHLPFLAKIMEKYKNEFTIVPIIVGSLSYQSECEYGEYFSQFLEDPSNFFIISSDFCHWGQRFHYTYYDESKGEIYKSIENLDKMGMNIIESQDPEKFYKYLKEYGNTICGRHPIAVLLQALKCYRQKNGVDGTKIEFVRYAQSNKSKNFNDSSVSYASAISTIPCSKD